LVRPGDGPKIAELWRRNPTEEMPIIGLDPSAVGRVIERVERLGPRIVIGLLRWLGWPIFRFFVVEEDGRLVGTTLLTFGSRSGYVGGVVVDAAYRRRGFARRMLAACDESSLEARRRFVVLDVLERNDAARALYASWGYRPLRTMRLMLRENSPLSGPLPGSEPEIREFTRTDARRLAALANALTPPAVREVLPTTPGQFRVSPLLSSLFDSDTRAWVVTRAGVALGFVRATAGSAAIASHLTAPLLSDDLSESAAEALVATALNWLARRGAGRIVVEVPESSDRGARLLSRIGFTEVLRLHTLVRALSG
jgi:ribosomal protein S18 acetylase RimI-like enzyme